MQRGSSLSHAGQLPDVGRVCSPEAAVLGSSLPVGSVGGMCDTNTSALPAALQV